jgi:hypothetical protein
VSGRPVSLGPTICNPGNKRIRKEEIHEERKERKSPVPVIGSTELCEGLGIVDQTTVLLHSSPPKPSHAVPRPLGP